MMEGLKIIEDGIVPVYETNTGEKVVYGTELHKVLQVKSNYTTWAERRLEDCDAIENEDYEVFSKNGKNSKGDRTKAKHLINEDYEVSLKNEQNQKGGRPSLNHIIKLDIAKEMAMLERNKKGKEVRRYFIQVEKKYKRQLAELADSIKQFMEQQTEFNKMVIERLERLEHLENPGRNRGRSGYKGNPFLTASDNDIEERKKELYSMTASLAELWGCQHTRILHYLYRMIEIRLGIVLDCYKSVYRSETGREDAGIAEVIASNDWIYEKAVELCDYAIEKVQNMN